MLDLVATKHLIVITRRQQVASIRGKAIYGVRDAAFVPLESQTEAERSIKDVQQRLKNAAGTVARDETGRSVEIEHEDLTDVEEIHDEGSSQEAEQGPGHKDPAGDSIAKASGGSTQKQSKVGRFAQVWFGRKTPMTSGGDKEQGKKVDGTESNETGNQPDASTADQPEQGNSAAAQDVAAAQSSQATEDKEVGKTPKKRSTIENLAPRIRRALRIYLASTGFYYSIEHDLSSTLTQRSDIVSELPLWKRFDDLYFWNRHLLDSFIKADCGDSVLPLMQGFVGQRAFSIAKTTSSTEKDVIEGASQDPEQVVAAQETPGKTEMTDDGTEIHEFLLTLISRRSRRRAGLRYLRRGVDDDGFAANTVETEQILSPTTWHPYDKTFSLVQLRGSIPLHFTQQAGTSLKPTPVLHGSDATQHAAFKKHLSAVAARYGQIQAVSLVDRHGPEDAIGEAFEKHTKRLNDGGGLEGKPVMFEWFDFHHVCRGMKFENVSVLIDSLKGTLKSFGWIVKQDDRNSQLQSGVVRTNCMDCLDRTNVVQSAIGGYILEEQLKTLGLHIDLKTDPQTQWFNTLWADNGDAIAREYAGTAAMKGDVTRYRKRYWTGALSDLQVTLSRYYNNVFGDYFMQANIDYWTGTTGPEIYDEFEAKMMTQDHTGHDVRRIRLNAIDACQSAVLEDATEKLIAAYILSCPRKSDTLRSLPFEECCILLTVSALYLCRFDWDAEKLNGFEKVELTDLKAIWRGPYITSGLGELELDETKNYGFALTARKCFFRSNTRSLGNEAEPTDEQGEHRVGQPEEGSKAEATSGPDKEESRLLAFKALSGPTAAKDDSAAVEHMNEVELTTHICDRIQKAAAALQYAGTGGDSAGCFKVEERPVISVADAKKSTGYVDSLAYSLKRLVWS